MGQGFSLAAPPAGAAGIDVPELGDLVYEKSIGAARFMKSIRARHHEGVVLVKVLIKPYPMSLEKYKKDIIRKYMAQIYLCIRVLAQPNTYINAQARERHLPVSQTHSPTNGPSRRKRTDTSSDSSATTLCMID